MRGSRCGAAPPLIRSRARDGRFPAQKQDGSMDMAAPTALPAHPGLLGPGLTVEIGDPAPPSSPGGVMMGTCHSGSHEGEEPSFPEPPHQGERL